MNTKNSETVVKNNLRKQQVLTNQQDTYYMALAIAEAKKGLYTTRPNPCVGCIIVKDGKIIGTGYHPKAGEPHAEVFALAIAKEDAQGATAYVTLEPCSHTGRTPPCALALINAKIKRVVIACRDSNPKVAGKGIKLLTDAGIEVSIGILADQAQLLNLGFLKAMATGMPYVRLKIATSLDGRTAMASGESQWITGIEAREDVQELRARSSAIITGSQTVIDDNPSLTVRSNRLAVTVDKIPQPKPIILDRRRRLNNENGYTLCQRSDTLFWNNDNLSQLLSELVSEHQCYDILVEAGSTVAASFIELGLVDELIVYQAPCILGTSANPMLNLELDTLCHQYKFTLISHKQVGQDLKLVFSTS